MVSKPLDRMCGQRTSLVTAIFRSLWFRNRAALRLLLWHRLGRFAPGGANAERLIPKSERRRGIQARMRVLRRRCVARFSKEAAGWKPSIQTRSTLGEFII